MAQAMYLTVLASSSDGNCYMLDAGGEVLLLDAGIRWQRLIPHLPPLDRVSGCLVTHEHLDHSKGAKDLIKRGVKVYMSQGTANAIGADEAVIVQSEKGFRLGSFTIVPFQTEHDAAEPLGFVVKHARTGESLLYATDTFYLKYAFPNINYWLIECNYVDELVRESVWDGETDEAHRKRLLTSHMSLDRLKDALKANDLMNTWRIILCHLSDSRSDERFMVDEIERLTTIPTVAARQGLKVTLAKTPF
jgi:phosphoribosyl 1,2-cyclic phosphodiesterase